ncbi:Tolloid-like protein 1 [Holothuria leucospilota]|uniref:Tolloid-like protein 1 n=1 Tax=Holothuria leucospilota TaxID=206669 RepID=A0A9Q0YCB3_HOLLE|nr:Tolloid-like protein 1 [Holothuria leucospilota]
MQATYDTTTNSPTTTHSTEEAHVETTDLPTTIYSTTEENAETTGPALCREVFYTDSSPVMSLNYPANYPDDLDCEYRIIASTENVIRLDFVAFEVEPDCDKDYVQIFEETPTTVAITEKLCGDSVPSTVVSTGHQVLIAFHSDSSDNKAGFMANIHFLSSPSCGVTYMNESSVITSPNYPNEYGNDEACHNWIEAPLGKTIQLTFTDFEIEVAHSELFPNYVAFDWSEWEGAETTPQPKICNFDFLEVYDGENSASDLILMSELCGKTPPPPLLTTGNKMYIYFESDSFFTYRGYRATYQFL